MPLTDGAMRDIALGQGGSYSLSRDVIAHQIWDTRPFPATISDFTYFQQPLGSTWRIGNKTLNETNLNDSGKLPNGQTFLVKRIGVALIVPVDGSEVDGGKLVQHFGNIMQSSVFEIRLAGRDFDFQVHGRQFLPSVFIATPTTATQSAQRTGDIIHSGWCSLKDTPIFVDTLVSFSVMQRLNNPDTNVQTILNASMSALNGVYGSLQVTLEGTLTRAK